MVTPSAYMPCVDTPLVYHPNHATNIVLPPRKNLSSIYLRKQVDILLYHPPNPRGISNGASSCLPKETGANPFMPPVQLIWHIKGIFLSLSKNSKVSVSSKQYNLYIYIYIYAVLMIFFYSRINSVSLMFCSYLEFIVLKFSSHQSLAYYYLVIMLA